MYLAVSLNSVLHPETRALLDISYDYAKLKPPNSTRSCRSPAALVSDADAMDLLLLR